MYINNSINNYIMQMLLYINKNPKKNVINKINKNKIL